MDELTAVENVELPALLAGRGPAAGRGTAGTGRRDRPRPRDQHDTYESIRRLAERQHRRISDVVREAINRYLEAS
jgi:hypothetical protein